MDALECVEIGLGVWSDQHQTVLLMPVALRVWKLPNPCPDTVPDAGDVPLPAEGGKSPCVAPVIVIAVGYAIGVDGGEPGVCEYVLT
jgi:hypothetical protein